MKIYLVGGAVRNKLLNLPINDKDWLVIGATPKIMKKLGYHQVGKNFPVFIHPKNGEEYSLARTEKKLGQGYTGFITEYNPKITLEQDLIRRDLTINAIAQNPKTGEYIDPYGGIKDIKYKILKHISDAFVEDPLRVLRVARFASFLYYLGFKIDQKTMKLMKKIVQKGEMKTLSPERIWKETENAIKSKDPDVYFYILYKCRCLNILMPDIKDFSGNMHILIYKTLKNIKKISRLTKELDIRFTVSIFCFFQNINKLNNDVNKFNDIQWIKKFSLKLKIPNYLRDLTILIIKCNNLIQKKRKKIVLNIINILYLIDAWRKPFLIKKISQIIYFSYLISKKNSKISKYLKKEILFKSFLITSKISIKKILSKNLLGNEIKKEIKQRRIKILQKNIKKFLLI